jgi:hypothetical protein
MRTARLGIGLVEGGNGGLDVGPKLAAGQEVLMLHGLKQRLDHALAEPDAEEGSELLRLEVQQRCSAGLQFRLAQGLEQVGQRDVAVGCCVEAECPRLADALLPILWQNQGRRLRHRINMAGAGLFVVVGRSDTRRPTGSPEGRRVPQHGEAV